LTPPAEKFFCIDRRVAVRTRERSVTATNQFQIFNGTAKVDGVSNMKSPIIKRSVSVNGHKTSISLEEPFWNEIKTIASQKNTSIKDLITDIDRGKQAEANLSSSLRVFILRHYRAITDTVTPAS